MKLEEFIIYLLDKKEINKEVLDKSLDISDFPLAYKILNGISDSDFIRTILNPKRFGEIDLARGDLLNHNLCKEKEIKQSAIKFIDELAKQSKLRFKFSQYSSTSPRKNNKISKNIVLGIDLGTTNTLASIVENGKAISIPMKNGERILPSVISINKKNQFDIGENAVRQQLINPEETFYSIKRFIGRRSDEFSFSFTDQYPFEIDLEEEKLCIYSKRLDRKFECEELSAQLLLTIKANAETYLDTSIQDCVITVPAYFDNNQRVATKRAAQIAGLNVKRLISEPTAAAFAYGISKKDTKSVTLVLDLGGGTFDISLVRSEGKDLESFSVIAHSGERDLGGDDYTNSLVDTIIKSIQKENKDVNINPTIKNLIREEAIKAKHAISFQEEIDIDFPMLPTIDNQIISYKYTLDKKSFERISKKHTDLIERVIKNFLALEKVKTQKFTKVVLVGGASRMPLFTKLIKKLTKIEPQIDTNPDEVISHGAAYCAEYTLSGIVEKTIIDVTPLSLGIRTFGDIHSEIIPPNTVLPTRKTREFSTIDDYQQEVEVKVYQGNRKIASDNVFLNSFTLADIESARAGIPKIDVTFEIDLDGILKVAARDRLTKANKSINILNSLDISDEEIKKLRSIALSMAEEDVKKTIFSEKVKQLKTWKNIFDDIPSPEISSDSQFLLDRVENCLNEIHKSGEDPDYLIESLKKIIERQSSFSI